MSTERGAPKTIEITPKMINAGAEVLADIDLRFESIEDVVVDVFNAMLDAMADASEEECA